MPKRSWFRRVRQVPTIYGLAVGVLVTVTFGGNVGASGTGLGTPEPAREAPVTIGMITDAGGGGGIGTSALVEGGAKMTVTYANAYTKGLGGHKIDLYVCQNQNSPAGGPDLRERYGAKGCRGGR